MTHGQAVSIKPCHQFIFEGQVCIRVDVSGPNQLDSALGKNVYSSDGSWHPETREAYEWSFNNLNRTLASVNVGGYVLAFNATTGRLMLLKHCTEIGMIE